MRKLLFIIAVLLSFGVHAQTFTPIHNYQAPDGVDVVKFFGIPHGETPTLNGVNRPNAHPLYYKTTDSSLYLYTGTQWIIVGGTCDTCISTVNISADSTLMYFIMVNGDTARAVDFYGSGGGSGGTYTASNGLTMVSNDVQLGGALSSVTSINTNGYSLNLSGNQTSSLLNINQNGNSFALDITGNNYSTALNITNNGGGEGVVTSSINGVGARVKSINSAAADFEINPEDNSTILSSIRLFRKTSGTSTNGIGESIDFNLQDNIGNIRLSNQIISKWTDATDATRTSEFSITGVNNAVTNTLLQISGAGVFTLTQGLTNYTDNAAAIAGGLTTGQLYRNGDIVQIVH